MWMMADNAKEALEQWQLSGASKVLYACRVSLLARPSTHGVEGPD